MWAKFKDNSKQTYSNVNCESRVQNTLEALIFASTEMCDFFEITFVYIESLEFY